MASGAGPAAPCQWGEWALEPEAGPRLVELRVRKPSSGRLDLAVKVTGHPLSWARDMIHVWEITAHLGLGTEMKQSAGDGPGSPRVTGAVWVHRGQVRGR